MTWLAPLLYALSAVATVLAWVVARRHPAHLPVALLLTVGLVADIVRRAITRSVLLPEIARIGDAPFTGWPRVAAHVDDALFIAWPAALAGAALVAFLGRRAWPVAVAYLVTLTGVVVAYPATRGAVLARVYSAAQLAAVMVALGCAITWYRKPTAEKTTTAQAALALVVSVEFGTLALSWRSGVFDNWYLSQIAYLILFVVLILMQGGIAWSSTR